MQNETKTNGNPADEYQMARQAEKVESGGLGKNFATLGKIAILQSRNC